MTGHCRDNEKSQLLSAQENESIFLALGRGCQTLSTAVVQLFLAEAPTRQRWSKRCCGVVCFVKDNNNRSYFIRIYDPKSKRMLWEQEIYTQFKYKTPREFFHTFEAHDCQAALNFASEDEAAQFKKAVENKLMERHKKRLEKKKLHAGTTSPSPALSAVNLVSGSPASVGFPAATTISVDKQNVNVVKVVDKKKDKKGVRKKLTKEDISIPADFRHVSHVGWDPNKGLDMKKLDPAMKALFEQIGIDDQSQVDEETIDFIYDFVDKHGGLNAVKEDIARRQPPPSHYGGIPQTPVGLRGPPPSLKGSCPPPPPARSQIASPTSHRAPPPAPGRLKKGTPPPPPGGHPAPTLLQMSKDAGHPIRPLIDFQSSSATPPAPPPPAAPAAPPPPPLVGKVGEPTLGRAGLLSDIRRGSALTPVADRSTPALTANPRDRLLDQIRGGHALNHVDSSTTTPVQGNPSGIVGALLDALSQRKDFIQGSDDDDDTDDEDVDDDEWDD